MALNFPDSPTNGQKYTDATTGETWTYEASTNSWTSDGLTTAAGIQYKGGLDITATPPAGVANGWQYTVTTGGTANAGFTGLSGNVPAGTTILYDGANWQKAGAGVLWSRTGTALKPVNSGDTVQISAGTAALPGLTPVGDPNTGVFSAGADQIGLATNGTGRLFIDSSGRVGVNTASPNTLLHLTDSAGIFVKLERTGTSSSISSVGNSGNLLYLGSSGSGIQFNTGATPTETARITSDGKLGLGTSSPSTPLHVSTSDKVVATLQNKTDAAGTKTLLRFSQGTNGNDLAGSIGIHRAAADSGVDFEIDLADGSGNPQNRLIILEDGKVGLSTRTPTAALSFSNVVDTNGSDVSKIRLYDNLSGAIAGFGVSSGQINYRSLGAHVWYDGTLELARLDASGRLLVGTSSAVAGSAANFQCSTTANLAGVAVYADNTAAKAGGLVAGDIYRKADGTLMITF